MTEAASRCIKDELGADICFSDENSYEAGSFIYFSELGEMNEHELDHVIVCRIDSRTEFNINRDEVEEIRWMSIEEIDNELDSGVKYSSWFEKAYETAKEGMKHENETHYNSK